MDRLMLKKSETQIKIDLKSLRQKQQSGYPIAIYCAGLHGILFSEILRQAGIKINAFLDSDGGKWDREITDGIFCLNPHEIPDKEAYQILICIALPYYTETEQTVCEIGFKSIVNPNDVFDDIILAYPSCYLELIWWHQSMPPADIFYTVDANGGAAERCGVEIGPSDRIAVYTGIFGDYDTVCLPQVASGNIDYYFVSDRRPENIEPFQWMDARAVIPPDIATPVKRNRYIKMHPHLLFPQYRYSVYIDGNVVVEQDITSFIKDSISGIAAFMHPKRDCIFYEAITIVNFRRVTAEDVCRQMERYLEEGMPLHYGLPEMPVIAREHHKPICIKVMEDWWKEFDMGAQRDQLSFMYAMWKNGMVLADMASLGRDAHRDRRIRFQDHICESKLLFNEKQDCEDAKCEAK